MAREDRKIWNQRYSEGAYAERTYPSEVLRNWLPFCSTGRALDIACGNGRNARYLAEHGYQTTGIDISDVAIQLARDHSAHDENPVDFRLCDLDDGLPRTEQFDLITMIRYVDRKIISTIDNHLTNEGCALFELHMNYKHDGPLAGPTTTRFRIEPGELKELCTHMEIVCEFEGLTTDPDGRTSALSRLLVRKRT